MVDDLGSANPNDTPMNGADNITSFANEDVHILLIDAMLTP